jgi:hypothetical protein
MTLYKPSSPRKRGSILICSHSHRNKIKVDSRFRGKDGKLWSCAGLRRAAWRRASRSVFNLAEVQLRAVKNRNSIYTIDPTPIAHRDELSIIRLRFIAAAERRLRLTHKGNR